MSLLDLFGARYHKVVVVTKPPPGLASPPQFGTLWSLWSVVPPVSEPPGRGWHPLGPRHRFLRMVLPELFAAGFPCGSGPAMPHTAALECLQQKR